jgi:two-component system cell cycle response regulator DivK
MPAVSNSKPSVLVVDDFRDGLELVTEYLKFRGFVALAARSGEQAINLARAIRPHIVLMDLTMPGIDGWQATKILKSDPATAGICVIAMTARALQIEQESAITAGCDGVIVKPFDLLTLANALPYVLDDCQKALNVPGLALPWTTQEAKTRRTARARHAE